eukprot:2083924-Pyramimonas_sp.AAC.1
MGIHPVDCFSQTEDPCAARGITYESGATDPTSGHMGSKSRIDDWLATLEGNLGLQREGFERDGQPNYCTAYQDLAHLSDHHPLVTHLHGTHMGIRVDEEWQKGAQLNRLCTKRLKKHMSEGEKNGVKDKLEEELGEAIAECAEL